MKFSVLISVYNKENPLFFDQALKSTLIEQSVIPNEVVIMKDGALTIELDKVIDKYKLNFPEIIKVIPLEENVGLGIALSIGLPRCKNNLVARMDSDDINRENRFEEQLKYFEKNPDVDVLGAYISEFYDNLNVTESVRKVPLESQEIIKLAKKRNPMNHVTVMFKKEKVLKAGNYRDFKLMEDYFLWIRMIENGAEFRNIEKSLVDVRIGKDMFKRRSNPDQWESSKKLQRIMLDKRFINKLEYITNLLVMAIFMYMPIGLKGYIYKHLLRK